MAKKFITIGPKNAITYCSVFKHIKTGDVHVGSNSINHFVSPSRVALTAPAIWFTNLKTTPKKPLKLIETYSPQRYPKYDNYDAIEIGFVKDIPKDYHKEMGVPITFLYKHNPEQFEIVGGFNNGIEGDELGARKTDTIINGAIAQWNGPVVNKQPKYYRIIIRRRRPSNG